MNEPDLMPPSNAQAEAQVVGAMLLDPTAVDEARALGLAPEDFWRDDLGAICRAAYAARDAGRPVDPLLLADTIPVRGLDREATHDLVLGLLDVVAHAANARFHAGIVVEKARGRALIEAANAALRGAYRGEDTVDGLVAALQRALFALGERGAPERIAPVGDFALAAMERIARRRDGEVDGLGTGLDELDEITGGFGPSKLIVLAARPSMGKTALALNVAEHVALGHAAPVLFVSLEMDGPELAERLLVGRSRVDGHRLRSGVDLARPEQSRLDRAYGDLRRCERFHVDETPGRTVDQIAAAARRHRARHGDGLVVVDYIQLIDAPASSSSRGGQSRQEEVARISRALKILAADLKAPVLALSQLNRQSEAREDKRPRMSDLRESGAIEQDADLVILLHRPEYYDPSDSPGVAEAIVAKNRNGRTGTARLAFVKALARFEPLSTVHDGDGPDSYPEAF